MSKYYYNIDKYSRQNQIILQVFWEYLYIDISNLYVVLDIVEKNNNHQLLMIK